MPITLAEAKKATADDIQQGVIDEFAKSSFLLGSMTFDDAVTPGTNQATLTYGYTRLVTQPTAGFRAINTEYTPQTVTTTKVTTELKVFGGAFEVDRIIAGIGGLYSNVNLNMVQKIKAAGALFHDTVINGDSGVDANAFDGLDKAITGSTTEFGLGSYLDLSDETALEANKWKLLDYVDEMIAGMDGKPTFLGMNGKLLLKIKSVARRAGFWAQEKNEFGQTVETYNGIPMIDMGEKPGTTNPVVPIVTRDVDGAGAGGNITGLTDIYAARLGLDAFHGVSLANAPLVRQWLPDFSTAGAVKLGEVEMVAATALKRTKAAAVRRNFKVQ